DRVRVAETPAACCWEGQQWEPEAGLCVGPPERCPPHHLMTTTDCIAVPPQDWASVSSCMQGNAALCYELAQPHLQSNPLMALGFYRLACDAGNAEVCLYLGNVDLDYSPDEGRVQRALAAWNRACDAEVYDACERL